ncbi:MAG: hypothetical protein CVV22_06425 [Ignavibacteriae bacterium HGW-Ignavibacteriae-1]|nr:MAG: hypothetical protein CVV22_06425 [Ignavibacteriae bacterium HGW-Ignavibacteriae-1]
MFRTILIFVFLTSLAYSQEYSGRIVPLHKMENGVVNVGPCLVNDSIRFSFEIINDGEKVLYMQPLVPSFYLGASPNDPTQSQFTFFRRITQLDRVFPPNSRDTLIIQYNAGDLIAPPLGWYEALLGLSLLKNDDRSGPPIAKIDTFLLRVKKVVLYLNGIDDVVNFDSVYIEPNVTPKITWQLKNASNKSIEIIDYQTRVITQQPSGQEFTIQERPANITIQGKNTIDWDISYQPLDIGIDSVQFKVTYKPHPEEFPDSVNVASMFAVGTGVHQQINLLASNHNLVGDTIVLGDVRAGGSYIVAGALINNGNIPFHTLSEYIIDVFTGNEHTDYTITNKFGDKTEDLLPDSNYTFIFRYKPTENGLDIAEYIIESDILERVIKGVQAEKRFLRFYIKANVVSPKIFIAEDTLNFGSVTLNKPSCLNYKDTSLTIYNIGNEQLLIKSIKIVNGGGANFFTGATSLEIEPNSSGKIDIRFENNSGTVGEYFAILELITNAPMPQNLTKIMLWANSTPTLSATISISDDLRASPGRLIEVPILLTSDNFIPSEFAKSFSFSLSYDRSILEYKGVVTLGTASVGAAFEGDNSENPGKQIVDIRFLKPGNDFFEPDDTLCKVQFFTYLGNAVATEIAIINPVFSDGNCEDLFELNVLNGVFVTDSVCGLELKAVPGNFAGFAIKSTLNSGSHDLVQFDCSIGTAAEVSFRVYDAFGNILSDEIAGKIPAGAYTYDFDSRNLASGIYFIEMSTPFLSVTNHFVIIK